MPRVRNFFAVAAIAVLSLAALHEVDIELRLGDPVSLLDDAALLLLVIGAVVWYRLEGNADRASWMPLLFVALAIGSQVLGVVLGDAATAGPNLGIGVMIAAVGAIFSWQALRG